MMVDRIFDKQKTYFKSIVNGVSSRPYSCVMVDNQTDTSVHSQIVSELFCTCLSYTLPEISRHTTIEAQSVEPMNTNHDDVQNFTDKIHLLYKGSTAIEAQSFEQINSGQSAV